MKKKVLLIGGAGYVGSELTKLLISNNFHVTIYDLFLFSPIKEYTASDALTLIKADIRNTDYLIQVSENHDYIIYLACISNDPSFDLNPMLGKSINYIAFKNYLELFNFKNCKRFIFASSSSVYGVSNLAHVNEKAPLNPLTDYSYFKLECEKLIQHYIPDTTIWTIIRPATVCGLSQRLRLDVVVNILTHFAVKKEQIKVFGGDQKRPNIHIKDMTQVYLHLLKSEAFQVNKKIFNVGCENLTVSSIAQKVAQECKTKKIETVPTDDNRSYHICSKSFTDDTGFTYQYTTSDAIKELRVFLNNSNKDFFKDTSYFNVQHLNKALATKVLSC